LAKKLQFICSSVFLLILSFQLSSLVPEPAEGEPVEGIVILSLSKDGNWNPARAGFMLLRPVGAWEFR